MSDVKQTERSGWRAMLRENWVPIAWLGAIAIAALVWRGPLVAWFSGDDGDGSLSSGTTLSAGELSLTAALSPDPPVQGKNALLVALTDKDGNPKNGATVTVTVSMPAMGSMQEMRSEATVAPQGGGKYRANFDLAMGGSWQVAAKAVAESAEISAELTLTVGTSGLVAVGATGKGTGDGLPAHAYAPAAKTELLRALSAYEQVRVSLAADRIDGLSNYGGAASKGLRAAMSADSAIPRPVASHLASAAEAAEAVVKATDMQSARAAFAKLSEHLIAGASVDATVVEGLHAFECPMTEGYGKWLQPDRKLTNPYKGSEMLTCGSEIDVTKAVAGAQVHAHAHDPNDIAHYTCPMDTWVKQKQGGPCPVCGMDLIAVTKEEVRTGVMRIDHRRRQLIGLKTGLIEKRDLTMTVNAIGKVSFDETRLSDVSLKYDGFIQKLYVEETGKRVRRGQTLLTIYSPEIYTAQQEYLLALSQHRLARDDTGKARADMLVRAAEQRLRLFDVTKGQLSRIAKRGEPIKYLPVAAPASGFVVAKDVVQGGAVKRGQRLYRIAALDKVWVETDIYEQDIPLVQVGQTAEVSLTHLPGKTFAGKVSFIYPYLDGESRTAKARIELPNKGLELKPDMYANVKLQAPRGERLVVPEAAVIYSGPRRVVFLDMDDDQLRPVPIEVGLKAGGFFEVVSGLKEGDRVVTSGNFLLSAESRLKAATGLW